MDLDDEDNIQQVKEQGGWKGVYIYHPIKSKGDQEERSSKRRRTSKNASQLHSSVPTFLPLLDGKESPEFVHLRDSTFQQLWSEQELRSQGILKELDAGILEDIKSFATTATSDSYGGRIPTALVTTGSNVSSLPRLLDSLHQHLIAEEWGAVISLESGDAPNLKTVLKNIIRIAVTNIEGNESYQKVFTDRAGPRMLPYDLNILHECVTNHEIKTLVLAFRNSEAFDQGVLNDLLSLISSWNDRIPCTLLFGISTSIELFEGRLPRSIVGLLQGRHFELHDAGDAVDRLYEAVQTSQSTKLWLGPHLSSSLFEQSRDHFQSPEGFIREVKYAYMSHFFANPLSVLLSEHASTTMEQESLCEAVRNLSSFRRFCKNSLDAGDSDYVRKLLDDDRTLRREVVKFLERGQSQMSDLFRSVRSLQHIQKNLKSVKVNSLAEVTLRGVTGDLRDSSIVEDVLVAVRKLNSDGLSTLLKTLRDSGITLESMEQHDEDLVSLVASQESGSPLRSKYDYQNSTIQTTIVNHRVNLSKAKKQLSERDAQYTALVERLHKDLEAYLTQTLVRPQDLFLHEVFLFDLRSPLKDTFAPRTRFSIERALSTPFDYLISASEKVEDNLSGRQPETAILYQLYLESGSLVNVFDLWKAFHTILGGEDGESCDERAALMLFYRALSELKILGMLKPSRKKVDHVSKSAWKGL